MLTPEKAAETVLLVRTYYDHQKVRVEVGNRLDALERRGLQVDMRRLEEIHKMAEAFEKRIIKDIRENCQDEVIWDWLISHKGIGPVLAGGMIVMVHGTRPVEEGQPRGIARFPMVSSLWHYCGLHVTNGKAPKQEKGKKGSWVPWARTLAWKTAKSFVMQANEDYVPICAKRKEHEERRVQTALDEKRAEIIVFKVSGSDDDEEAGDPSRKRKAEEVARLSWDDAVAKGLPVEKLTRFDKRAKCEWGGRNGKARYSCSAYPYAAVRDARARRYMIKEFIKDLWVEWYKLEGLTQKRPHGTGVRGGKRKAA